MLRYIPRTNSVVCVVDTLILRPLSLFHCFAYMAVGPKAVKHTMMMCLAVVSPTPLATSLALTVKTIVTCEYSYGLCIFPLPCFLCMAHLMRTMGVPISSLPVMAWLLKRPSSS